MITVKVGKIYRYKKSKLYWDEYLYVSDMSKTKTNSSFVEYFWLMKPDMPALYMTYPTAQEALEEIEGLNYDVQESS